MSDNEVVFLGDVLDFKNGKNHPGLVEGARFQVFGANGPIGLTTDFNSESLTIVIGRVGSYCGSLHLAEGKTWVTDNAIAAVAKVPEETKFWFYALRYLELHRWRAGSGQPLLTQGTIKGLKAPAIGILDRIRIAEVLGALDDLIDTNQSLIAAIDGLLVAAARRASEGLRRGPLGEHIEIFKGLSYKGEHLGSSGTPMLNLASFGLDGQLKLEGTKYYAGAIKPRHLLSKGDLVVCNTDLTQKRELLGRPVLVPFNEATCSHHTFVARCRREAEKYWVYGQLRLGENRSILAASATGTTVAALPADVLLGLRVAWPDADSLLEWSQFAKEAVSSMEQLRMEISDLRRTRDELLPLLMSGKIRVREAEELVKERVG